MPARCSPVAPGGGRAARAGFASFASQFDLWLCACVLRIHEPPSAGQRPPCHGASRPPSMWSTHRPSPGVIAMGPAIERKYQRFSAQM